RDTPAGREVAGRWLGLRAYLRGDESFANLPPSAVAVWDRYLSYGDAVGATRVCSAVIDLGMGNRKRVWSSFGGSWHRVRVQYPKAWPRYGKTATRLILRGIGFGGLGFLLLYYWAKGVARVVQDPSLAHTALSRVAGTVTSVGTGAWGIPTEPVNQCRDGDTVTLTARRWSRRIIRLQVVETGSARRVQVADPDQQNTEALVALAMGLPAPGQHGPAVPARL